jgi:hypothetical protein
MTSLTVSRPETSGYNKMYRHQWRTNMCALPGHWIAQIEKLITGNWGWHFIPHKNMDYRRENWYEDQTLFITFEKQEDLIQVRLCIKN